MRLGLLLGSAVFFTVTDELYGICQGCPGSTCISPVWLERCNTLSLSLQWVWVSVGVSLWVGAGEPRCPPSADA